MTYANDIVTFLFLPFTIIWGIVTGLFGVGSTGSTNNANTSTGQRGNANSQSEK